MCQIQNFQLLLHQISLKDHSLFGEVSYFKITHKQLVND
jgi:hypothetical protein